MMAGSTGTAIANHVTLKRSFTAITISSPPSPDLSGISKTYWGTQSSQRAHEPRAQTPVVKRRDLSGRRKMPSAAGPRMYENHIPSFMAVYGMDSNIMDGSGLGGNHTKLSASSYNNQQTHQNPEVKTDSNLLQIHSHQHRESTSTQASDSTDSSPTTTVSTVDSSSLSDPSPSSSPESPVTLVPLSSFTGSSFGLDSFQNLKMGEIDTRPPPITVERPMTSPSPRKKNPKSLALNLRPSIDEFTSEPSSPSFIKPPPLKARKKPSILSLNTGTANMSLEPFGQQGMSSMLQRRSLKHSVSSPQILSMTTPGFGPSGGMTLGDPSRGFCASRLKETGPPRDTFTINEDEASSPTGVQMATRAPGMSIGGDSFDRPPTGEDCKSPSYPDGPILMHEPTIHLYSEPKMEEAAEFDVVINVAREVKNPFEQKIEEVKKEKEEKEKRLSQASVESNASIDSYAETPGTAGTISSFRTAYETQPAGSESSFTESSPSTPRPSTSEMKIPEYIHIPWDHNTDVQAELWDLCQTIESRAKEGKKILVHCQQGASRSATLIIAYGMYINQDLSVNEAYNIAQSKSRWVNPNMSLHFSLSDFKKILERKKAEKQVVQSKEMVTRNKGPTRHRQSLSANDLDNASCPDLPRVNSSSPLRNTTTRESVLKTTAPAKTTEVKEETSTSCTSAIDRLSRFDFGFGDSPKIEPFTKFQDGPKIERLPFEDDRWQMDMMSPRPQDDDTQSDIMSPRIAEMTRKPFEHAFARGIPQEPSNGTPSLFSPRGFEFKRTTSFFPPTVAIHPNLQSAQDPRSPPITGEATITRSIDDFL